MKERLRVYAFLRNDLVIEKDMYVILHVPWKIRYLVLNNTVVD